MGNDVLLGFAEVDITPSYNIQTVGFHRKDNLSEGILHRLVAQISVWQSDEGMCCLIAIDHIGFMCRDANLLRDEIGKELGIAREKVMLCFSHTHSAPNISLEPEYFRFLREQILSGVGEAEKTFAPVEAAWGVAEADIGINRRNPQGVLDRRIGLLKIVDHGTGSLRLLILRVTAHANVLLADNRMISSDFIGVTRGLLEKRYGCKVMITQGASGNVRPKYDGSLEALDKMASGIRDAIAVCLGDLKPGSIQKLSMFSQKEPFFADVPTLARAKAISDEAMRENNIDGAKWLCEVARLHNENIKIQSADIEIQYFVLNNGCLCGVPNEIMCELALDVVKACNDDLVFFGGYTNGCDGYLPTAEEYDKGGYEVLHSYLIYYIYHGRVMPLNQDTADRLAGMVAERCNKMRFGGTQKIETQRLILRRFDIEDAQSVFNNWMSDTEVQNNYGEATCSSEAEVRQKLQLWISMYANIDFYRWAIILKESNEHIGQIAFFIVDSKNQRADVEYCIGLPFWGKGYATEALKAVIDYAFSHAGFNRVQGFHRSKNPSSGKVLQKAGMRYEGTLRQYLIHMDEFDDCIMYSIIRQEWEDEVGI